MVLQVPFSGAPRRFFERPLIPEVVRDAFIRAIGAVQSDAVQDQRLCCGQFVPEAYWRAGLPTMRANPRLATPADRLRMRGGDILTWRSDQVLE